MGEMKNAYTILVRKPEGQNPFGRPRHRWEDNMRINLGEIRWEMWTGFIWLSIGASGRVL
jgi:hypothetical protein